MAEAPPARARGLLPPSEGLGAPTRDEALPIAFSRAERLYHHLDEGAPDASCTSHDVATHAADAVRAFISCAASVRRDGLTSLGETAHEMKTEDLRYLLLEYYVASLRTKYVPSEGPGARLRLVHQARSGYEAFLDLVRRTAAVPFEELGSSGISAIVEAGEEGARPPNVGGAAGRGSKIERYKRSAAAKRRLEALAAVHAREAAVMARSGDLILDGVGGSSAALGGDDASRREMALLVIGIAARAAVDEWHGLGQEEEVLQHAIRMAQGSDSGAARREAASAGSAGGAVSRAHAGHGPSSEGEDERVRGRRGVPVGDISIDPNRPGLAVTHIDPTFAMTREIIRAEVFTDSARPPTLGLEDWGTQVLAMAQEREAREKVQNAARPKTLSELQQRSEEGEAGGEEDEEAFDIATARERRMDDWKDGVPKGMGNTKRV